MTSEQQPIIPLICSCCDGDTIGRQWWNRGHGFGVCPKCADWISKHRPFGHDPMTAEEMHMDYGVKGIHYGVEESHTQPSTQSGQAA